MTPFHPALPFSVPVEVQNLLDACPRYTVATDTEGLVELATRDADADGWHEVAYDIPGKGRVVDAKVCRTRNAVSANYTDPYMRRRDPDCLLIGDDRPTDKKRFADLYHQNFDDVRKETFEWLKGQELCLFAFYAGDENHGLPALVVAPANAGFFALGLAMLQGLTPISKLSSDFHPKAVIYVAPTFRYTHFDNKQLVVHNRTDAIHELFSYNLYPGPSAKKGVYGVLIHLGEQQGWVTAHCSTVQVVTPYDNIVTIMHEGASGGGKSEMLEHAHREQDGRLLIGSNLINNEKTHLELPRSCDLQPVTDDMALCHPELQTDEKKLTLVDAENAWFVRVNHIEQYGTAPQLEHLTIHPPTPLLTLNIEASPGATTLIWEHVEDAPNEPCPNPRVVIPRKCIPGVVDGPVTVDIRSFGVRTPPCTAENPSYGIMGMLQVLPPALAWLWRLVAPRGHGNPSIVDSTGGLASEGVGSYWPFATGRRVDQANLLLKQIQRTTDNMFVLIPNQHIGCWKTGFMSQWISREYLVRRGMASFRPDQLSPARCSLLGEVPRQMVVEGMAIPPHFLRVEEQPEVGTSAYDEGAEQLYSFFHDELTNFLVEDLSPLGSNIIDCCLQRGTVGDYASLLQASE